MSAKLTRCGTCNTPAEASNAGKVYCARCGGWKDRATGVARYLFHSVASPGTASTWSRLGQKPDEPAPAEKSIPTTCGHCGKGLWFQYREIGRCSWCGWTAPEA